VLRAHHEGRSALPPKAHVFPMRTATCPYMWSSAKSALKSRSDHDHLPLDVFEQPNGAGITPRQLLEASQNPELHKMYHNMVEKKAAAVVRGHGSDFLAIKSFS